MVAFFFKSRST